MYKNRQHPTEVECRLFCCPILLGRCRFCSFLKLLSYRHTADAVLLLSFLFAVALPMVPTAYYVLTALQSLRHGFAVPPPFTQGMLWCVAKFYTARYIQPECIEVRPFIPKGFCSIPTNGNFLIKPLYFHDKVLCIFIACFPIISFVQFVIYRL